MNCENCTTKKQERLLRYKPEIIVATPGRLWELLNSFDNYLKDFSHFDFLVLDEADRMIQEGHYQELQDILELLPSKSSE